MSGIAEILLNLGYKISGSDLTRSPITERLGRMGATVFEGHAVEHIRGADVIVYSSAISPQNPEYAGAKEQGVPTVMRGELLAELMRLKYGIAVAGSHGKTTTTSMTAAVLHGAAKDPTVVVGGRVGQMGSNARVGKSDFLLVEADESDGSFLRLAPILAVITNVDREHLDHYSSDEAIEDAFVEFANKTPFYGSSIVCIDNPVLRRLLPRMVRRVRTYGESADADLRVSEIESAGLFTRFRLSLEGRDLGVFEVQSVGRHNALNAAAAAMVGLELDATPEQIREGLRGFIGVDRRFQLRGRRNDIAVVDDYGHHPTEIAATLAAAATCGFRSVHVLFQPHRYSRTQLLADEFAACFGQCDSLTVVDVYSAGEQPLPGADSPGLTARIQAASQPAAHYAPSMEDAVARLATLAEPGDVVITLGAGNVWRAGDQILERLEARAAVSAAGD
ncbi:MAG: UDP-N-acetylmuramate--L-alanine ligase [Acidobacteria bacterium]|nr:UDP-N-acetylmuramate--L-alanine ligase [Acidobacteriota bacterium]